MELVQAIFGAESDAGKEWLEERCYQLKQQGGTAVLAVLESLDMTKGSESVSETHRRETNYFRNHQHKKDSPRYVAEGWHIGSGPVERACKTVVKNRFCGSGMR